MSDLTDERIAEIEAGCPLTTRTEAAALCRDLREAREQRDIARRQLRASLDLRKAESVQTEEEFAVLNARIAALEAEAARLRGDLDVVARARDDCPVCGEPIRIECSSCTYIERPAPAGEEPRG